MRIHRYRTPAFRIVLAMLIMAAAGSSLAESFYRESGVEVSGRGPRNSRECEVLLLPTARRGEGSPVIRFATAGSSNPYNLSFDLEDSGAFLSIMLVQNNLRRPLESRSTWSVQALPNAQLWQAIRSDRPFFITAHEASGNTVVSGRFEVRNVDRFLTALGDNCPFYAEGLMGDLTEIIAEERDLRLGVVQLTHIRWVLSRLYSDKTTQPDASSFLRDNERSYLQRFTLEHGLPISRYLTRASTAVLLNTHFNAVEPDYSSYQGLVWYKHWYSAINRYVDGEVECTIGTPLQDSNGALTWAQPVMRYLTYGSWTRDEMHLDMVSPSPFDPDKPIYAEVDGFRYDLESNQGFVKPTTTGRGEVLHNAVIAAIRRGSKLDIVGTDRATGQALKLTFSAKGFTAAFLSMMDQCNREGLRTWIQ